MHVHTRKFQITNKERNKHPKKKEKSISSKSEEHRKIKFYCKTEVRAPTNHV